jgi:transcriptional regulator with XRE-family HTH domain
MYWGKLLRNLLALGFSVTDLSQLFGVRTQAISQWLHGSKQPSKEHRYDLLSLHALVSEHVANGGAVDDFITGKKWSPHTLVFDDEEVGEGFRSSYTPARLALFKAGEMLPKRDRTRFYTQLIYAQALETLAQLTTAAGADPTARATAQELDNLYHAAGILQQAIFMLYYDKALRTLDSQPSQEDPDAQETS